MLDEEALKGLPPLCRSLRNSEALQTLEIRGTETVRFDPYLTPTIGGGRETRTPGFANCHDFIHTLEERHTPPSFFRLFDTKVAT
ncbi:hypothetical protein DY000_02030377 [Brassica cretica]|uniref:Uncharacterized protein n=1 Tax=Brassica cretica TaxID=69181 RepID=A0ABQ7DL17_BRACR|nr:hypothetical protein DY000_02030377 [Brassica cretica]